MPCAIRRQRRYLTGLCAVVCTTSAWGADLGSGPPPARSAGPPAPRWTLSFTPYGWLSGLDGDTTVKGRTIDVDVGPFTVLEHLDGVPLMGYAEARNGPLSLYSDIVYAPLAVDASGVRTRGPISLEAALGVDVDETIVEAGATYEVGRWNAFGGSTAIDVVAGARYWRLDVEINLSLAATLDITGLTLSGDRALARAGAVEWVDPLAGLRLRHQLAPGHELILRGDVGGFEAGSTFSWNVVAAYSFQFAADHGITYSGVLGYRALSVDFEKGSDSSRFEYDMIQHGPVLGLMLRF